MTVEPIRPEKYLTHLPASCETFVLELETTESKKAQLEKQVKLIFEAKESWMWLRMDVRHLVLDETIAVKTWEWIEPSSCNQSPYVISSDHRPSGEETKYVVKALTFSLQ